jgi:hypothetical protein
VWIVDKLVWDNLIVHTSVDRSVDDDANYITSGKHDKKKEPESFSHCSSFDHLDLQSLNDYIFVFFGLPVEILRI